MSDEGNGQNRHPEYDFKWCPGCGDFGVRRALEGAISEYNAKFEQTIENTVVVAGIGCSGNLVHLVEGPQPYGIHGIHGRTLPIAFGIKMIRPELNVIVTAGDGDFLSIGGEHIAPQASRNLDITVVIMDNGVYGLTKGQSSPTTVLGEVTSSTPYGKFEMPLSPLDLYLTYGVTFIASGYSSKPKDLVKLMVKGMEHRGFSIIQVQSPCTTYNDTYATLKGNLKLGIEPGIFEVPEDHDVTDKFAASKLVNSGKIPIGVIYDRTDIPTLEDRINTVRAKTESKDVEQLLAPYVI